ncbi:MAG: hypothetical protein IJ725_04875, partial [Ruminococcus sp.]|nr:hypothetical protein [Ruminococcus sp.]
YGSITLAAIAIVVVAFVLLLKYIRNPDRKHKILVHELAHEHKITETTQIPRKHIFSVTKPTNTVLTKYAPVGELRKGKRGKKSEVIAEESRDIRSYSEPAPEETVQDEPVTAVSYDEPADEIAVAVEQEAVKEAVEEAQADIAAQDEASAQAEQTAEEEVPQQAEKQEAETVAEEEPQAEPEKTEEKVDISELDGDVPVEKAEAEPQKAVQSEEQFDATADYFDVDPEEGEMFSYADVDTAVEDYTKAKRRLDVNEDEDYEDIPRGWDTVKKVLAAIGRGIAAFFRAVFAGIVFGVTHLKYFCINLSRMIRRNHAAKKRRKAEEQRRREASERRRMEREAERARRRNNANRGANDLVQVRSSYDRRPSQSSSNRQRVERQRVSSDRRASDYRRSSPSRSSRPRR